MTFVASVMEDTVVAPSRSAPEFAEPNNDFELIEQITQSLRDRIGDDRHDQWFAGKTHFHFENSSLVIETQNAFAANWIRAKFAPDLRQAASHVLARSVDIAIRVQSNATPTPLEPREAEPTRTTHYAAPTSHAPAAPIMNPKYTLEEFVVGPSNQMAFHAAAQVAQNPGAQFNPLFLHGNCGLGKTHLLQAICHRFAKLHPAKKFLYLTAEQFTNEFIEAMRAHKTDAFRKRIRSADLLVIDDVHFLGNKKATQEEFLHTFNQVDGLGKQVVLASDCAPKQIHSLSEQLSSRFISGMVLRVDSPDLPTRLEILRRRTQRSGWQVSDSVLMHIAQSNTASVRELEGLLLQTVAGIALINAGSPDANAVVSSIKDRTAVRGPVPADRILACVADHFSLQPSALLGSSREKTTSTARAVAMYLSRRHTGMSFPEIGRALGNKNHSTVIAACQRIEALLSGNDLLRWNTPTGPKHQAITDLLHDLEITIRRAK